ncbi:hypothetical protein Lalb_Chr21g0318761 [Lupinus albus]|uniref:Uncharacterized protein n=1 Tax=Lupinus albus TaxID=3870 RepID=A0A6A4NSI8_LUPAL|nr:hypothetical protein Lalb_Chr21g0318761 [Lupinus albus]
MWNIISNYFLHTKLCFLFKIHVAYRILISLILVIRFHFSKKYMCNFPLTFFLNKKIK